MAQFYVTLGAVIEIDESQLDGRQSKIESQISNALYKALVTIRGTGDSFVIHDAMAHQISHEGQILFHGSENNRDIAIF